MAVWGVPFVALLFYVSGNSLKAYLAKKGDNLATKEDIGAITREVEEVKDEFNRRLEDLKAHHQLRMVAAERRLQAHQEAFTLWSDLMGATYKDHETLTVAIEQCRSWYRTNCIYLGSASRDVFMGMIGNACSYLNPVLNLHGIPRHELMHSINDAGNKFLEALDLPGFTEAQRMQLSELAKSPLGNSAPV
jgi:hypothetical protein